MAISYGTYTITEVQEGSQIWTTTVAPAIPSYTFTVSNLIGDSNASVKVGDIIMYSYYRYTVLSVSTDGTTVFAGNRQGFASTVYQLIVSPVTVIKDKNGVYSPYYVTLTAKSKTGTNTMGNYHGRFRIETTTDNENWEIQYTSTLNEPTVELDFSELDDIVALRCSLYASGGTSTLLDQQVISVVTDGVDGNDAYTVILTNENHTFAGNTTSAIASEIECNVIAYKGTTQVAATIGTITGQPTGMTTSLINNGTTNAAFGVSVTTSMVTKNGVLNIPITVDGKDFTKKFTYSLALDGVSVTNVTSTNNTTDGGTSVVTITMSDGTQKTFNVKNGNKGSTGDTAEWFYGTALTHKSGTATATITGAVVGSMYLNTETSLVYKCTNINGSTMTWTYAGDLTTGVINNIEIGGRNLLYKTGSSFYPVTATSTGYYSEFTVSSTRLKNAVTLEEGATYTLSLDITSNVEPFSISVGAGNGGYSKDIVKIDNVYSGRKSITFSPTEAQLVNGAIFALRAPRYTSSTTYTYSVDAIKLEKGNIATDWTPAPEDIEEEVTNLRTDLQSQIDEKIQTYYQATAPSWSSATDRTKHDGDLWYCTNDTGSYKKDRTYRYDSATNIWVEYSATSELFDRLDGKTTVYYGTTSGTYENVETGDYLVDSTDGSSYRWDGTNWIKVTDYQTAIDGIEDDIQDIQTNVSALQPELIIGTHGTTTTATWTGTSQNLSSNDIKSGTVIQYKLSSAGKANVTLKLTLKDNTTTGAIPVYYNNTTRLGTQYGINAIVTLVYDGSTTSGAWRILNPYTNNTYNLANRTHVTAIKALEAIAGQKIICGNSNGYIAIGASKTFDLSYPILYAPSEIKANATSTGTFETYSSVKYTTTGTVESGNANLIIYLKGTVSGNTFLIAPTNFFTTIEPTSEDGFYYIPLGIMSSTTIGNFVTSNRLFAYIDGAFQSVDIAATKVAVNYLSSDTTGVMVADMNDGYQIPSEATGRNVFIDSDSVDIRDGQRTLASFRGEDAKFYDVNSDNKEVASFGSNGVCVGNKDEQHFIVDTESIQAINENGSPIFSVASTGGTITSDIVVAKGFNSQASDYDVILNGGISSSENTFYPKDLYAFITIQNSRSEFTSFSVSINSGEFEDVSFVRTYYTPQDSGLVVRSSHRVDLPRFLFHYGTEEYISYQLEGVYTSDKGNTYRYSADIHIDYDGQRTITMESYHDYFIKISGDAEDDIELDGWNEYLWGDIYSSLGYTKAPAMTFGTRGNGGTIAPLSVAIGQDLYANNENQLSIGKYNLQNNDGLAFVIGNGTDDANRSNAFTVNWDGNTEVSGDLEVANNAEIVNDINVGGDVNIAGVIKSNNKPMFKVVDRAFTAIGIGSGRSYTAARDIGIDGYKPMSIGGIKLTNNSSYNPSSNADASWCVIPAFWLDYSDTIDHPDIRSDSIYFYIWNMHSSKGANVNFHVRIVYIATDALGNN